ncbi:N-acetylglucosamine kinase [Roseivirga pacifica]|uniref:N-acetylglucosamine kinase n=1 Tax=Roseivirga pacifica TaxID=1267423 RepID=A0A1I0N0C4_9BACT|nr:ROK family protein [Roseivirga pacifica]RKQ50836.1 N-acetylglucosamine kinase [Roseivirga pacifica]SEV94496.1 N-acetylglucosamine kinase [Roseivirga pacifica]
MANKLWGIDLGGTKIEGIVLESRDNPKTLVRTRIDTESDKGYEHVLNNIKRLIDMLADEVGEQPEIIGMGTPGTIDPPTGLLKNSNSQAINKKPFKADLETLLGIPVLMANDANCFALAETRMGIVPEVDPNAKVVFGVIMGTGCGGGVVVNNQIIGGKHGIGGEWGHNFLDESGGKCYCGKSGCTEKIISGTGLEDYYEQLTGTRKKLKEIIPDARSGTDENAVKTLDRLVHFFGLAISTIINVLDPDVIVLGGGVGNIPELYDRGVAEATKYIFNPRLETKIVKPKLGDSAGVFGAAYLCE